MVQTLKTTAGNVGENKLAHTVRNSAQQVWLAGQGAFSTAQGETGKVFDALVKEGRSVQAKTRKVAEAKVNEMTSTLGKMANKAGNQASANLDRLERVLEDRIMRALNRVVAPINQEIQNLAKRIDKLSASVQRLSHVPARKLAVRKPAKRKAAK